MTKDTIVRGFYLAGAFNIIGILTFSRGMTNELMTALDPTLFAVPGMILICVWGLAYLALAGSFAAAPKVSLVFAVEKLVYVVAWVRWMLAHFGELPGIWARDWMTGLFYSSYGLLDAGFGLFFLAVWARHGGARERRAP